ncbi:MAG: hypothetical protein ABSB70_21135 [Candidatus Velthaea sp.]|jgi:uncharacterized protein with PIN domain
MASEPSPSKIEAIYQLRDAVEAKARAEAVLEHDASPGARDALLAAQLEVEAKTQDAIEVCHECGHEKTAGHAHAPTGDAHVPANNVIQVNFRPRAEGA